MKQDLVVVVYEKDILLCQNFVKSVDIFTPDFWNKKWIIVTDRTVIEFVDESWTVVYSHDIFESSGSGYVDQQIAKLIISQQIISDWYWVFDAKNFLVRTPGLEDLYHLGRARVNVTRPSEEWLASWDAALDFYGVNYPYDPIHNRCPYPVNTAAASRLTGKRNVEDFADFFINAWNIYGINEFFLYNARLLAEEEFVDLYYPDDRIFNTTLWPKDMDMEIYQPANLRIVLKNHQYSQMPVWSTGLHRTAIMTMTDQQKQDWQEFMTELGLFEDLAEAEAWFRDQWFKVLVE